MKKRKNFFGLNFGNNSITSEFNFCEDLQIWYSKKRIICFTQFCLMIYITDVFNFYEINKGFIDSNCVIIYKTGKFSSFENSRNFIDSVLGNNLHN